MKFRSEEHQQMFVHLLSKMRRNDAYHRSAAYLMALVPLNPNDVFDFEEDGIKHEGLFADWQTGGSLRATRLMFNLWNGCHQDLNADKPEDTGWKYAVDEIFCYGELAPWFYEAVKIRFEMV